jgi:(p)ppGpp synthase/HD superfamily hydrolase
MIVFDALEFAAKAHRGQFRKGTKIPYLIHPLRVARILIEAHCSDAVVAAGLLHDTLEDTPVTLEEIRRAFGPQVADWVAGVSEPDKSNSWEFRKQHTLEQLHSAPVEIVVIACADKLDNIQSIRRGYEKMGEDFFKRFNRPRLQQQWYYSELARIFNQRLTENHFADLAAAFDFEVKQTFFAGNLGGK